MIQPILPIDSTKIKLLVRLEAYKMLLNFISLETILTMVELIPYMLQNSPPLLQIF